MKDALLFSLVLAQRVFDYEDIGWVRHRSKKFHDPFVMTKANIEKLKKDVPSSLKAEVDKTPSKRGVEILLLQFLDHPYLNMC
ncbi:hypothetical protein H5410_037821 [Solanum commersonii]|uniref:Uncharacterized protein n=1 Tax=Solanum commersonii TaxID=4109 RepID=A0A9J5Y903_SOLCO|nr:hypothetical protein H5410_037821 [Solanum commersonii]